jgi:hypothetical protein
MFKISSGKCTVTVDGSCQVLLNWPTEGENKFCLTSNTKYYAVGPHKVFDWDYQNELANLESVIDSQTAIVSPVTVPNVDADVRVSSSGEGCVFIKIGDIDASVYKSNNITISANATNLLLLISSPCDVNGSSYYPDPTKILTQFSINVDAQSDLTFASNSDVIIIKSNQ